MDTQARGKFSLDNLSELSINDYVQLNKIKVATTKNRGNRLVAEENLSGSPEAPPIAIIPSDVVITRDYAGWLAHNDTNFRQLVEAVGFQPDRQLVLLAMLMHLVILYGETPLGPEDRDGLRKSHWNGYLLVQPHDVPVPTMWSPAERALLNGTSLESALGAKLQLLEMEWNTIVTQTTSLPWWNRIFTDPGKSVQLKDWIWLDALFRSRSFSLPVSGEAMVPYQDLANHSRRANAYWRQDPHTGDVFLMLKEGCEMGKGEEVMISYGRDKPAAEMLFNYGFIAEECSMLEGQGQRLVMPLDDILEGRMKEDEFLRAKMDVFGSLPLLELRVLSDGVGRWSSHFAYLLCTEEEDGLTFEMEKWRKMLFHGKNVTAMASMFGVFVNARDELRAVVPSRAVDFVIGVVEEKLRRLGKEVRMTPGTTDGQQRSQTTEKVREQVLKSVSQLKDIEMGILERCLVSLRAEKGGLDGRV
ncbi:SET domain-containing protein [Podospora australis]|uniref:SET domain-containing protein n=1 Tax=Podospora australis TaxID=1536484 RepID=A0AAN6WL12_9PEZI|nr:SET domain-containing protein [Podospora australis]